MNDHDHTDAQQADAPDTSDELAAAAPVDLSHDGEQRPTEEEAAVAASAASSEDNDPTSYGDDGVDLDEAEQLERHPSSAGFGTTAKFSGARADRDAQAEEGSA